VLFAELDLKAASTALVKLHLEELLLPILIQLVAIITIARVFGNLARRFGQPAVVGEIVAGLVMGPSLVGWLFPELSALVFRPHLEGVPEPLANAAFPKILAVFSQIGLIFLLFLIGLEFEFSHLKVRGRAAGAVSLAGVVLPFAMGIALGYIIHPILADAEPRAAPIPRLGLVLFMGVAMSITAIPILGRIMIELGINRTKLGAVVITAAAIDDAIGWILLATVAALAKLGTEQFRIIDSVKMILLTIGFAAAMLLLVRPLLVRYFARSITANNGVLSLNALTVLLVSLLVCAIATNLIGIFAIFGAFLLGAILSDQPQFRDAVMARLRDLVTAFFLPIFFTYTGLRTDVGTLNGTTMWLMCIAVMAVAVIGKFGGCLVAAKLSGFGWKEASIIGVMMNTRALMELIVINMGRDLGLIPPSLFCMLVMMAILTTIMTTPILVRLRHGTEIEAPIEQSGFLKR
jgi:Kef-type K+ transport system membrane component KefB